MFELLTGELPFSAATDADIGQRITNIDISFPPVSPIFSLCVS